MTTPTSLRRIALLFNANKGYDRDILTGIAAYLRQSQVRWQLLMEDDFRCQPQGMADWGGDGIIADFDDPAIGAALAASRAPVVAVGSSYRDSADYPPGVPYVATDNAALVELAYDHLVQAGLHRFAMFSVPPAPDNRWAQEREQAFAALAARDRFDVALRRGHRTGIVHWDMAVEQLAGWLRALPKPIGIIAVTDARARQLLQACAAAGIAVPEEVAVIGIDNDALAGVLAQVPLSSVIQGAHEMGRAAAQLMHRMLQGAQLGATRILVPPAGVSALASCRQQAAYHPHVMRALHYIRQYACHGIKAEQVADYVGMSRSGLESHFRRDIGRSVHDEVLRFRLDAATKLLARAPCNISEVALRCGFTSVQYLYTVFARELGCTPRNYHDRMVGAAAARALADAAAPAARRAAALVQPA